jgi:hypothetical protein
MPGRSSVEMSGETALENESDEGKADAASGGNESVPKKESSGKGDENKEVDESKESSGSEVSDNSGEDNVLTELNKGQQEKLFPEARSGFWKRLHSGLSDFLSEAGVPPFEMHDGERADDAFGGNESAPKKESSGKGDENKEDDERKKRSGSEVSLTSGKRRH